MQRTSKVNSLHRRTVVHRSMHCTPWIKWSDRGVGPKRNRDTRGQDLANGIEPRCSCPAKSHGIHSRITSPARVKGRLHARNEPESGAQFNADRTERLSVLDSVSLGCDKITTVCSSYMGKGVHDRIRGSIANRMKPGLLPRKNAGLHMLDQRLRIDELPADGLGVIAVRVMQARSVRPKGAIDEEISPGATGTQRSRSVDSPCAEQAHPSTQTRGGPTCRVLAPRVADNRRHC